MIDKRCWISIIIAIIVIIGISCGGGFKQDSGNADQIGETIFGPDSSSK